MADNGTAVAAQPGASAPAAQPTQQSQSSSFQVPDGYALVSKTDHERLTRAEQQARGFQPMYDRLSKAGIKSVEDWGRFEPDFLALQKRGFKPGAMAAAFSDEADKDLEGESGKQQFDPSKFEADLEKKFDLKMARKAHADALKGDDKILQQAVLKALGEGEHSDYDKEMANLAAYGWFERNRGLYPQDHPLHSESLSPYSEDMIDKYVQHLSSKRVAQQGKDMADKAKQAAGATKKPVGTVGGGGGAPSGKPNTQDKGLRPGGLPSREAVEMAAAARAASR